MTFGMPFLLENGSVEDACTLCRELNLAFVELNANFPSCQVDHLSKEHLLRLKEVYGIDFTFHVEEECDPFALQKGVRHAWLDSFRASLRLAKAAGIPIVNMHLPRGVYITLPTEKVYLYERYQEEYRAALADFRRMCQEELSGSSVRIAIENTDGFRPHEQAAVDFLLESGVFGLTLDIGHLHAAGDGDWPFYQARKEHLIHMHGHDAKGKKNHLALGDGEIDLRNRFDWAKHSGARIVLETKTIEALKTSVGRLQRWL